MPTKKTPRLGKLSLAILENFVQNKLGEKFVDELRKDFDESNTIIQALEKTENRFLREFPDKNISKALFVDLEQKDRPNLKIAVNKFFDHPTDTEFRESLLNLLVGEFNKLIPKKKATSAIDLYIEILTEELALIDEKFGQKITTLATIRAQNTLRKLNGRPQIEATTTSINSNKKSSVQLLLDGDFRKFNQNRKNELIKVLSALLHVSVKEIRILNVYKGSIIVDIEIPEYAIDNLLELAEKQDGRLVGSGILSVKRHNGENILLSAKKHQKTLHLITGSKGGVGKTLLSIAIGNLLQTERATLCIDLNWQNPDISVILGQGESFQVLPSHESKFVMLHRKRLTILRQRNPFTMPNGSLGFWKDIAAAIDQTTDAVGSPDSVVVDTCMHAINLFSDERDAIKETLDQIHFKGFKKVYIWFIWTLAGLKRNNEKNMIERASETMKYFGEGTFNQDNYFVHVLSPYALNIGNPSLFQLLSKVIRSKDASMKIESKLLAADTGRPVDISTFEKIISSYLDQEPQLNKQGLFTPSELISKEILESFDNKRPSNIVPILTISPNLYGLSDSFTTQKSGEHDQLVSLLGKPRNIRNIKKDLKNNLSSNISFLDSVAIALEGLD